MNNSRASAPRPKLLDFVDIAEFDRQISFLNPEQQNSMRNYLSEAEFFSEIIYADLAGLPIDSSIVEVGSGVGWLVNYFRALGMNVVGIEPSLSGFSQMEKFQSIARSCWNGLPIAETINATAENFETEVKSVYSYSVNVMEHVQDIEMALLNIANNLQDGGIYRFVCPNYRFPYEPHFNLISLINRKLTFLIYKNKIMNSEINPDNSLWLGLNWITPRKVRKEKPSNYKLEFSNYAFIAYLKRLDTSERFKDRKGNTFLRIAKMVKKTKRIILFVLPTTFLPVMDVKMQKKK